ncbi:conserved protein, unknown function [Hepatocystis sp. ex Piliocolobus tephrosceles]|nr:conserved protein, unknown function [Hepatocystis sp. ex Piliocolobus tephrosceles]
MNHSLRTKNNLVNFLVNNPFINKKYIINNARDTICMKQTFSTHNTKYKNNFSDNQNPENTNEQENSNSYTNPKYKINNSQIKRNLSVFGHNRGKIFVSIKKDFNSFVVNSLIISVFLYSIYTLAPKETISQRRKRILTERLMKEYEISPKDLEMIEEYEEIIEK